MLYVFLKRNSTLEEEEVYMVSQLANISTLFLISGDN